jgi:type I restriction enzyme S subunit
LAVKERKVAKDAAPAALPEGWRVVRFDEMAQLVNDRVDDPSEAGVECYVGLEHLDPESLKIRRWGSPDDVEAQKLRFQPGDIIFGKRRAYQRKLAVADFEGICSAHAMVLRAREETVVKDFLPFFMQSDTFFERALSISVGSLSPTINWKTLASQQFAIPPKDEQRRIAEILCAADKSYESYLKALKSFDDIETAIVASLTDNDGKDEVQLKEIADVSYGLTINASRRELTLEMPYLRVANVMRGSLNLDEIKTIGCTSEDIARFSLESGDVLVVEGHASVDEIGRSALWRSEIEECLHQNHILRVRCSNKLIPHYLVAYLNSSRGRSYFKRHAKSTSGLNTINSTVLKEMRIPFLSVPEQQSAVNTFQSLERSRQQLSSHILVQGHLKKNLLKELLEDKHQ